MALEQEEVINTLTAPKSYTRPLYCRVDKSATGSVTVGHKMATYNSKEDGETADRPRRTHSMNLTEDERDEMAAAVFALLYKFQKKREEFAKAKDV
jgi:hypothetical protein